MPTYQYKPHQHVKIWLSNNHDLFMNTENQMRLIDMREKNPKDSIHFIYDSSLLSEKAIEQLQIFCQEHNITPIDADGFAAVLSSDKEKRLYELYQDEITHLQEGGNLAVASDILRWLSPVYQLGSYTDFDVPVDTSTLPATIEVSAPLLLNIGSLKVSGKEVILSNNDYIAIVDAAAAQVEIAAIQDGFISVLENYSNDFVSESEKELGDSFLNRFIFNFMKNRSESVYIARSNTISPRPEIQTSSRELRHYIQQTMTDTDRFLDFKREKGENNEEVIVKLRKELSDQLGFVKWLFFGSEYQQIKRILAMPDEQLLNTLMQKERSLYLKSIVVCTTGPIALANFLFKQYICSPAHFTQAIQPYSFNHYELKNAFQSKNSINMHENIWGMMNFLGAEDGQLNDSSWLEEGVALQKSREQLLLERKEQFQSALPVQLRMQKQEILDYLLKLQNRQDSFWGFLFSDRRIAKINALAGVLNCFKENDEFDLKQFKSSLEELKSDNYLAYAGIFGSRTKQLINRLEGLAHQAVVFGLSTSQKLNEPQAVVLTKEPVQQEQEPSSPYSASRRLFDVPPLESQNPSPVEGIDNAMDGDIKDSREPRRPFTA